jgi:photosystem II stability/assembly factor-like uncharacterized protein
MRRRSVLLCVVVLALGLWLPGVAQAKKKAEKEMAPAAVKPAFAQEQLQALAWREVGPYRGGRSAAVTGIAGDPLTYYFGSTGGGVWKTTDAGVSWKNVSDGFFGGSIGAVAVSEWDPNVVYVGTGESTVRGNVSHGDGMWKSTDAGKTWTHIGLGDSRHIPRVRIHPKNPDLVYVAALGHLFGPNEERGVFRSQDGGKSWEKVLYVNEHAGAIDLAMDPTNPRVLYASFWRVLRTPYSLESGGEGSGIWKSTDGGDSWTEITANQGMPKPPLGISGISVSQSNPENVYAIIEAKEGGVFRSRDGGETWARVNEERKLRQRAWYYTRIVADPADEDTAYVLNVQFHRSKDGGKSWEAIRVPHGDNHDLWIAPENPLRMIESNDGGASVSFDAGETWSRQDNQPTAQMYRVSTDNDFPYRLLGGQQDNSTVRLRSRSAFAGSIGVRDWEPTAGGESGHVVAKPDDPEVVYGGSYGGLLIRMDHRTGAERAVNVWPDDPMGWGAAELKYRFQWNFPVFFSPHDPNRLYAAAQVLFVSDDEGASWRAISPDLTRDDKSKMGPSGGPITKDNTSVEYYGTIFAVVESPLAEGVLWTGSDDGLIHVSRNGGESWDNVTPPQMPEWAMVNSIDAHPFEPGGLYVAATRYKLDDFKPYLYVTTDYGKTWRTITAGIADDHFTRVIRADPDRRGLLYAGTERGVYVSFDDGAAWQPFQGKLPIVPVTDLAVKEGDLIAATQGRGYWIMDDLSPLHALTEEVAGSTAHLFEPRAALRVYGGGGFGFGAGNAGTNPPAGALIYYYLGEDYEAGRTLTLDILAGGDDEDAEPIRSYTCKPAEEKKEEGRRGRDRGEEDLRQLDCKAGLQRFAWNLSYPGAKGFPKMILWNSGDDGPPAVPGWYRARLTLGPPPADMDAANQAETGGEAAMAEADGDTATAPDHEPEEETLVAWQSTVPFEVKPDPRSSATAADYQAQFDFISAVRDTLSATHREIGRIREARGQIEAVEARIKDREDAKDTLALAQQIRESLDGIEKALYQTQNQSPQDPLNFPVRLNDKLAAVLDLAIIGDNAPTAPMIEVKELLTEQIHQQLSALKEIWDTRLPEFNAAVAGLELPAVALEEEDDGEAGE